MRHCFNHPRRGFRLAAASVLLMAGIFTAVTLRAQAPPPLQASGAMVSTAIDVSPGDLRVSPPGVNWPSYNGDYSGRRYSSLSQINSANVGQLRAQWAFHVRASSDLEVTPVAVDGILFISAANDVYAVDARAGRTIWHYSRPRSDGLIDDASQHHSRGVAVWHSRVYILTDNAHLLCLDARSGHLLWDVAYTNGN
ncbi:MAG: PQQ-binding-like beta-propeller repeat protein, partial [Candidatus Acidiferrales bacterium]